VIDILWCRYKDLEARDMAIIEGDTDRKVNALKILPVKLIAAISQGVHSRRGAESCLNKLVEETLNGCEEESDLPRSVFVTELPLAPGTTANLVERNGSGTWFTVEDLGILQAKAKSEKMHKDHILSYDNCVHGDEGGGELIAVMLPPPLSPEHDTLPSSVNSVSHADSPGVSAVPVSLEI
jgi:hypothetical protein